jgi:UDP-2,3-diacylglucosamine hydrolase
LSVEEKDWIFVSDAHFTGKDPAEMESFLRFLDSEQERMGHLVILGDLFEFFFGFRQSSSSREKSFAFPEYLPVLEHLQRLYHHGIRIKYFEGNHDFFLRDLFTEQFGMKVEVYSEGVEEGLGERKAFIAHGDLSNPGQWKYRVFRKILKNRWTYAMIHLAGPRITRRVAARLGETSYRNYHATVSLTPPPVFRSFAERKFSEGFDLVILGHSHVAEEVSEWVGGRRCLYFNVGAWRDGRSFLRFTPPDRFELSRFMDDSREIGR